MAKKKSPTIEEVKKAKIALESGIMDSIKSFEKENGVRISYIDIQRVYEGEDSPIPLIESKPKGVKNVSVEMDLGLLYD